MAQDAPAIWPDAPGNIALDWEDGDAAAVDRRVRPRRARRAGAADRYAAGAERDGAARRHRELRRAARALHADRADAGRRRGAQSSRRRRVQSSAGPDPRPHARRGRRLRHEGAGLFRICRHAVRGAPRRAAGEVVRQPAGELSHRHPWPRRRAGGRARARCRWKIPRPARAHLCRHRRLYVDIRRDLLDHQHQELPLERLCHSGDPHRREDGADQCGAARAPIAAPGGRRRSI